MALHALNRLNVVLCLSCFEQAESWLVALHVWGWKLPYVSSCFGQDEIWSMPPHASKLKFVMMSHALNRLKVVRWLFMFEAESHPLPLHALNRMKSDLCLLMLQSWNSAYGSSWFKQIESCAMSLMLWTGWKLTCGSSCLRLKVTLCLFLLWTGWHLICASPCFKAQTHPVSLHASNRFKLILCLSCFEINRLKVTLCLFMLWTGWHLTCASSCFKPDTRHVSLHALNRLKLVLCPSCFEEAESWPVALHVWGWKSPLASSCFELDEI